MLDRLLSHGLALVERALRVPWLAEARSVVGADAEGGLDSLVAGRGALSILGLGGPAWGPSAFYDPLDGAINRVLPGLRERNPFERRVRGIGAVVVLALSGVLALGIGVALPTLQDVVSGEPLRFLVGAGEAGLTVAVLWAGVVTIYRLVPTAAPSLSAAGLPALAVGCGIWLAAQAYALLTPLLVGGLAVFGGFVSPFGLLISPRSVGAA